MLIFIVAGPDTTPQEGREAIGTFCAVMQAWVYVYGPGPGNVDPEYAPRL